MTLKEQIEEMNRGWRLVHEWENRIEPVVRSANDSIMEAGFLVELLPPNAFRKDEDPRKEGISRMFAALAKISRTK